MRSVLTWVGVGALGVIAILAAGLAALLGGLWWDRDRRIFHRIDAWWARAVLRMFPGDVEVRGLEHLASEPYVIAANHQSVVDLLVLYLLPVQYRTVVKRALFWSPLGWNIWTAGYVPTPRRGDPSGGSRFVDTCADWVRRGISVLIFPEGTRNRDWEVGRFRRGAFELAAKTARPVLPVAIAGTNDISHPSSLRFALGRLRIIVEVMPPISSDEAEVLKARCHQALSRRVDALRAELRERYDQGPVSPADHGGS